MNKSRGGGGNCRSKRLAWIKRKKKERFEKHENGRELTASGRNRDRNFKLLPANTHSPNGAINPSITLFENATLVADARPNVASLPRFSSLLFFFFPFLPFFFFYDYRESLLCARGNERGGAKVERLKNKKKRKIKKEKG